MHPDPIMRFVLSAIAEGAADKRLAAFVLQQMQEWEEEKSQRMADIDAAMMRFSTK